MMPPYPGKKSELDIELGYWGIYPTSGLSPTGFLKF